MPSGGASVVNGERGLGCMFGGDVDAVFTDHPARYGNRMAQAASDLGLTVVMPD